MFGNWWLWGVLTHFTMKWLCEMPHQTSSVISFLSWSSPQMPHWILEHAQQIPLENTKGWVAKTKGTKIRVYQLHKIAQPCLQCFQHANNEGRLSHRRRVAPWLRVASPSISVALVPISFYRLYSALTDWILFEQYYSKCKSTLIYIPTGSMLTCTMSWSTAKEHLTTLTHTSWITWFLFFPYLLKPHFCTEECSYPTFHGDMAIFLRFQSLWLRTQEWWCWFKDGVSDCHKASGYPHWVCVIWFWHVYIIYHNICMCINPFIYCTTMHTPVLFVFKCVCISTSMDSPHLQSPKRQGHWLNQKLGKTDHFLRCFLLLAFGRRCTSTSECWVSVGSIQGVEIDK